MQQQDGAAEEDQPEKLLLMEELGEKLQDEAVGEDGLFLYFDENEAERLLRLEALDELHVPTYDLTVGDLFAGGDSEDESEEEEQEEAF